jgi:hypothetical protein
MNGESMLCGRRVALAIGLLAELLAACGGGGSDGGTTSLAPQIAMTLTSFGGTVAQGQSITFGVTVTGSNGFTGPATITVAGAPAGVSAIASASQFVGNTTTSTVSITVSTAVGAGMYPLTVTGSGSGVESVTRSFALTVTALAGGFTIAASAPTVTLAQGSSATSTITIARTGGFAGSVGLAATGMSNGLTATFAPASATGTNATLSLTASSVAVIGTVTLTITGSAASLPVQTISAQVTVVPGASGGAGSVMVDFSGCGAEAKPIWFAYQDGGGTWTRVTSTNDIYRFMVTASAGGYAFAVRPAANASSVAVKLLSRTELTTAPINFCRVPRGNKTVVATVSAVGTNQQAAVNLGGSTVHVPASATVSIPNIPNGPFDLVAWRMNGQRGLNTPGDSKGIILRDVNVPDGGSAGIVDFDAATAAPMFWGGMSFTGANSGDAFTGSMSYYTGPRESCTAALLYNFSTTTPSVPVGVWGFPAAAQRPTDFYVLNVVATNGVFIRMVQQSFHTPGGEGSFLHFGGSVSTPVVSDVPGGAYRRLQVVGTTPGEYSSTVIFLYANALGDKAVAIETSVAWLGGNAATLTFPDFSGVSGWDSSWIPGAQAPVLWTFGGTAASFSGLPCTEGALFRAGYVSGEK